MTEIAGRVYAKFTRRVRGMEFSEVLGWHILPNIEKESGLWCDKVPALTNSHGWRDAEHRYERRAGFKRIVALGDSFTFGHGVDYGDRFTERLEELLPSTEVINMGACAYGTDQEWLAWKSEGRQYQPDLVLLTVFAGNDLDDIRLEYASGWSKPYFTLQAGELHLIKPTETLLTKVRTRSYLVEAVTQLLTRSQPSKRRAAEWKSGSTLPLFRELIRVFKEDVEARGAKFVLVLAHERGNLEDPTPAPSAKAISRTLEALGVLVIDTWSEFQTSAVAREQLFLADGHWRREGHALVAEVIADKLQEWAESGTL